MINWGGWLLLTGLFAGILLLIQRADPNRRVPTALVLVFVWSLIWGYGIYRISGQCDVNITLPAFCGMPVSNGFASALAWNTTNMAALAAVIFNLLFWMLLGRYNPPRSGDEIRVIGIND